MNVRLVLLCMLIGLSSNVGAGRWSDFWVRELAPGIYFGPAPNEPSEFRQLHRIGVQEVIDLRAFRVLAVAKERGSLERVGISYHRSPMNFDPDDDRQLNALVDRLAARPCGPIFVHCSLGRDRTGLVAALYRVRYLGWPPDVALDTMKRQQFNPRLTGLHDAFWRLVRCAPVSSR